MSNMDRLVAEALGDRQRESAQHHVSLDSLKPRNGQTDPGGADKQARWVPRPLSVLSPEGIDVPWILPGYLARRTSTNYTGLWKIGKTTWLSYFLKACEGGKFCGEHVAPVSVLVVSEESETLWARRRDELGIGDHVQVITRPFLGRPDVRTWERFIGSVAGDLQPDRFGLVVFDSLFNLWPVRDENDAAGQLTALMPLNSITESNVGLLLITHPAKADAGEGRATRGSGALSGWVDIIVEMRRYDPGRREDCRRVLTAYSRFEETPGEIVLSFDRGHGYNAVGTKSEARADDRIAQELDLLPTAAPGLTVDELLDKWPKEGLPRPSSRTALSDLSGLAQRNRIGKTGKGVRSDPHRFYHPKGLDSIPASPGTYPPPCENRITQSLSRLSGVSAP